MEQLDSNYRSHKRMMEPHKSILGPEINDFGSPKLWGCESFGTPYSNVYMCWKTTSTLVYIMAHTLNAMEQNFLTPFLTMIDKDDRLKNTGGNAFILLKRG